MTGKLQRLLLLVLALGILQACKLRIEVPEGGFIMSASGRFDCVAADTAATFAPGFASYSAASDRAGLRHLAGRGTVAPMHDDNEHCEIDITDATFDETFTAVPYEGYAFSHWRRVERGLFGDSKESEVRLKTTSFADNDALMGLLASGETFYLEPVFTKVNRTGNSTDCDEFDGSFARIQSIVFDGYGCTNSACHGGGASAGGLDLSPSVAYDNLIRVDAAANLSEPLQLVYPGEQKLSFLFQKVAAATTGTTLPAGAGQTMPIGGPALTDDHLEALRLWIRNGAPEAADVDDVASLLGCSAPTLPQANKIDPPPPPATGEGLQFVSGPWTVEADSENEVCFATYYDLEKQPGLLPEWAKTPCSGSVFNKYDGSCFAANRRTLTQDPQSHHSIIDVYVGETPAADPSWGQWQCLNGPHQGTACDPTRIGEPVSEGGADCGGDRYVCGTEATKTVACRGWGADDLAFRSVGMGGAQSPIATQNLKYGVYEVLPTRGVIAWNSHAFNLSDEDTTVEQYNSYWFAPQDERQYFSRGIFDAKDIFVARVPPFEQRTYCSTYILPEGARLTQLSSHAHKRGILWQTWLPPQDPACTVASGCEPNTTPADYVSRVYNDPLYLDYDPPLVFDSPGTAERAMKFCVTYDNGAEFPELLKRNSTSVGTTCLNSAYCVGGSSEGSFCGNSDSACGDGGSCDACRVTGGVTTEDEMFLLLGNFYVVPADERNP